MDKIFITHLQNQSNNVKKCVPASILIYGKNTQTTFPECIGVKVYYKSKCFICIIYIWQHLPMAQSVSGGINFGIRI